jgi:predicted outer membrane repeat protein
LVGGSGGDAFGTAIALRGERLLIGTPGDNSARGAAFLLEKNGSTWILIATYTASDGAVDDRLGESVALSEDHVLVGAPGDGGGAGAAYVFDAIHLDCNGNGIPDVCDTSCLPVNPLTGASCGSLSPDCGVLTDCDFNTIPDECQTDCNTNGIADTCDIANGALDCNTNGVPDSCEPDCNGNGIADDCDITDAFSDDCNSNAVPDECELAQDETILFSDFESGALPAQWSATGLWHITDQCASGVPCDGLNWAYFGIDGSCDFDTGVVESGILTAPSVYIPPAASRAVLSYCSNYDGDRGIAPDGFDAAWVEVNGDIVDDISGTVASGFWETRTVDLSAYAGLNVTITWHFDTNDTTLNNRLGWQIDQVSLEVDSDCNLNGVLDACDIAAGIESDCNSNGVPDACELASGDRDDCNSNGIPDDCESQADCDANDILDICELETIYVDAATIGLDDGSSWANAYNDLQDALTAADAICIDVEIWVAAGTYTPTTSGGLRTASFELHDNVALYGGFSGFETQREQRNTDPVTNNTILSGDLDGGGTSGNSYHVVTATDVDASAILDGFTIRDGYANGSNPNDRGAGLYFVNAGPKVANCLIASHDAIAGAIAIDGDEPAFDRCTIVDNAGIYGGGTYIQGAATPSFVACRFLGNAVASGSNSGGGGAYVSASSSPTFRDCLFAGNIATERGGALYSQGSTPTLINCTVAHNLAGINAGGVYARLSGEVLALNTVFWENQDAGGNDETAQLDASGATLTVRYATVQGWTGTLGGVGNIALDPLFADADGQDALYGTLDDDFSLSPTSPCVDAGSSGVVTTANDLGGFVRRIDDLATPDTGFGSAPIVDIGAYEFQADCNTNGQADSVDIATAASDDCNGNFIPDECEIDPAAGAPGGPYFCTSNCDTDCNVNGVPDACDISGGTSNDCSANGTPDECESDCDNNGIANSCEIAAGTSDDCNANGIPDDCDLAEKDCDNNGRVDECEMANPFTTVQSGKLSPVEAGTILSFSVPDAIESIDNVVLTFLAKGDLGANLEAIDVRINGTNVGTVFDDSASDCPVFPNQDQIVLTASEYNALLTGNDVLIEMEPTLSVDLIVGCESYVEAAIQYLAFLDCNANGVPDSCEPDCNANGVVDACDITEGFSSDCNANGVPDSCDLSGGTSSDTNLSGIPDDCELDCNGNSVPDECDVDCANDVVATGESCNVAFPTACGLLVDCDENNVPDTCDPDCDFDGINDSCAIAAGTAADCNANDVPDACDLAGGGSTDCDNDLTPDDCQPDADSDGVINVCDDCPNDPAKTIAGVCGCGVSDIDTDEDGVADCIDLCADTPPTELVDDDGCPLYGACCLDLGQCFDQVDQPTCELPSPTGLNGTYQGNGTTCQSDRDGDLIPNCDDACPDDASKSDPGACGCGVPDIDSDADTVPDCFDLCPDTAAAEPVDSNGCRLYGACCNLIGACFENTFELEPIPKPL